MSSSLVLNILAVVVAFIALTVSVLFAIRQITIMRQANQMPAFVNLIQEYRSPDFQQAEYYVMHELDDQPPQPPDRTAPVAPLVIPESERPAGGDCLLPTSRSVWCLSTRSVATSLWRVAEPRDQGVNVAITSSDKSAVAGFYHDRPLWIGRCPVDLNTQPPTVAWSELREVVFRKELGSAIEVKITVEGFFEFDFSKWAPAISPESSSGDSSSSFDKLAEVVLNRTMVMNAFLAFLYTNALESAGMVLDVMLVTPELMIAMSNTGASFGNSRVTYLYLTSYQRGEQSGEANVYDERILHRMTTVSLEVVERAADNLSSLMTSAQPDGLLLADLFLRASKAYKDHNYSSALITYWAVTEKLVHELWRKYREDSKVRDGVNTMSRARQKILDDGRSFTASVIIEILYFGGYIDHDLYAKISNVRKKRNDWIHRLSTSISGSDALSASEVTSQLLQQARGISLRLAGSLTLRG